MTLQLLAISLHFFSIYLKKIHSWIVDTDHGGEINADPAAFVIMVNKWIMDLKIFLWRSMRIQDPDLHYNERIHITARHLSPSYQSKLRYEAGEIVFLKW